jgi:hypothetical protein
MDTQSFIEELSKLRSCSTFLTISGYRNEHSEISDAQIVFHMSYENALKKSIETLQAMSLTTDLQRQACAELIASYTNSLTKVKEVPIEEREDHYTHFPDCRGVKIHTATGHLHIYGLVVNKVVKMPGQYPVVNSRPLTVEKKKLSAKTRIGNFRQYKLLPSQVDSIQVENLTLLPPT